MVDYLGTGAGVREICRNLGIAEVPDNEIIDDLKYGFGKVIGATNKTDWNGTEKLYGMAVKVDEEFAAVNIALRTNVDVDTITLIRKIANEDLEGLANSDSSLFLSEGTGTTTFNRHGGFRKYKYFSMDPENNEMYQSPVIGSGNDF